MIIVILCLLYHLYTSFSYFLNSSFEVKSMTFYQLKTETFFPCTKESEMSVLNAESTLKTPGFKTPNSKQPDSALATWA